MCCTPMYSKGSQDEKELCACHRSPKWPFTLTFKFSLVQKCAVLPMIKVLQH